MPNWMVEFALWAPNLNVVEYHGSAKARASIRQFEWHANKKTSSYKFNVLLTTYKMVLADSTHLRGVPWEVLVVDEGYRLKNASTELESGSNAYERVDGSVSVANRQTAITQVEDILRWGTKELFTDKNCRNKDEAVGDVKHNQRKKPSGLRDVYGDKCTGGNNKIVWDKNAIIKLLDRSNRHSSDNTKGNLENDLPGSVKINAIKASGPNNQSFGSGSFSQLPLSHDRDGTRMDGLDQFIGEKAQKIKKPSKSLLGDNAPSTSVLLGPHIYLARKPLTASFRLSCIEPDLNMPPLDLNTVNLSSSLVWGPPPEEKLNQNESGDSSKT
ncbi:hypothetical protein LguiA_024795 [Lonicera macranthoides]